MCTQKKLEKEVNELTSESTVKGKDILKLRDDNKRLSKKISESKVKLSETMPDEVCMYWYNAISCTYL